jgi:DNA ligase-3
LRVFLSLLFFLPSSCLSRSLQAQEHLAKGGDSSRTCAELWERSGHGQKWSSWSLAAVDSALEQMTGATKQEEQLKIVEQLCEGKAHVEDVRYLCRLVCHDLRIQIGAKYVLNALHPRAFDAWKKSNDLKKIVAKIQAQQLDEEEERNDDAGDEEEKEEEEKGSPKKKKAKLKKSLSISISNGTPIKPMLARASKSYADAAKRCPNGMRVEIKYDGERLQIHKNGEKFQVRLDLKFFIFFLCFS